MNSPKRLNYETRPAKFTERKMLLSSILRVCNQYKDRYQYIGLGGLAFTDFKSLLSDKTRSQITGFLKTS